MRSSIWNPNALQLHLNKTSLRAFVMRSVTWLLKVRWQSIVTLRNLAVVTVSMRSLATENLSLMFTDFSEEMLIRCHFGIQLHVILVTPVLTVVKGVLDTLVFRFKTECFIPSRRLSVSDA